MFWIFASVVLLCAIADPGFRKFLAVAGGAALGLALIALVASWL